MKRLVFIALIALGACSNAGHNATPAPETTLHPQPSKGPSQTPVAATPDPKSDDYTSQGVAGFVTAGPTCPVERPESPCPDRDVPDATVTASDTNGKLVKGTRTDVHGEYTLKLDPGFYDVTATARGMMGGCETRRAQVKKDKYTQLTITCDTGIR